MDSIYQSIEILSKEKGIDAQIVLDAVKDAMLIAARKHFRTVENYEAVFDENSAASNSMRSKPWPTRWPIPLSR